jgi:hypothetical protein
LPISEDLAAASAPRSSQICLSLLKRDPIHTHSQPHSLHLPHPFPRLHPCLIASHSPSLFLFLRIPHDAVHDLLPHVSPLRFLTICSLCLTPSIFNCLNGVPASTSSLTRGESRPSRSPSLLPASSTPACARQCHHCQRHRARATSQRAVATRSRCSSTTISPLPLRYPGMA